MLVAVRRLATALMLLVVTGALVLGFGSAASASSVAGHHHATASAQRGHTHGQHKADQYKADQHKADQHKAKAPGRTASSHPAARHPSAAKPGRHVGPAAKHGKAPARQPSAASAGPLSASPAGGQTLVRVTTVAVPAGKPASHRTAPTAHRPTTPAATRPGSAVGPGETTPLQQVEQGLTTLTSWSPFTGPLGWLFTAMVVLAVAMIVTAYGTGRGAPWRSWRRPVSTAE